MRAHSAGHLALTTDNTKPSNAFDPEWADDTLAIRFGFERSQFGEHGEPIMTTSSYVFSSAAEAAARFSGESPGPIYSRFTNPTVQIFEKRLAALEGTEACIGTASGMAATATLMLGTLQQGDEIVTTRNMFGSTVNLFKNFLPRYGIKVHWADGLAVENWHRLIRRPQCPACGSATRADGRQTQA